MRRATRESTTAAIAPPRSVILTESDAVSANLIDAADVWKRPSTAALQTNGDEQLLVLEEPEECRQELLCMVRGHPPLLCDLPHSGIHHYVVLSTARNQFPKPLVGGVTHLWD